MRVVLQNGWECQKWQFLKIAKIAPSASIVYHFRYSSLKRALTITIKQPRNKCRIYQKLLLIQVYRSRKILLPCCTDPGELQKPKWFGLLGLSIEFEHLHWTHNFESKYDGINSYLSEGFSITRFLICHWFIGHFCIIIWETLFPYLNPPIQ